MKPYPTYRNSDVLVLFGDSFEISKPWIKFTTILSCTNLKLKIKGGNGIEGDWLIAAENTETQDPTLVKLSHLSRVK